MGIKCFLSGLFVHGGVVGFRASTLEWPRCTRLLCRFVRENAPGLRFTTVGLFRNMKADAHVDSNNSRTEPNFGLEGGGFGSRVKGEANGGKLGASCSKGMW